MSEKRARLLRQRTDTTAAYRRIKRLWRSMTRRAQQAWMREGWKAEE